MYEIHPASEEHLDQMVPLLLETGYYEYMAANNKLNLQINEFLKITKLASDLDHTHVLVDVSGKGRHEFAGFFISYPQRRMVRVSWSDLKDLRDDDALKNGILKLDDFYHEGNAAQYLIADTAAIHPAHRGKGLYRMILDHRREMAEALGCRTMKVATWESNPSRKILERCGIRYVGHIDISSMHINDRILKGILDFEPAD